MCLLFSDHATSSIKLVSFKETNPLYLPELQKIMPFSAENELWIYKWLSSVDNFTAQDFLLTVSSDLSSASDVWWFFFFVMLILKVSLQRSVTAVSHKETNRRDYLDLQKFFLSRICGYFFTKFFLLLLLNDSLFKREKKDSGLFFQVAAWHLLFDLCKINYKFFFVL